MCRLESIYLPRKKNPYQPSATEWAYLATFTNDLEPTNLARRNIIRGEDWIKSTWTDCRKYLHQMFVNYNRSGQHDDDKDEWGSEKELRRWSRAAKWNSSGAGSIIRFPNAMIYSIAILDICDFESIGRRMPKGTGVDATVDNGAVVAPHKKRKRKVSDDKLATTSLDRVFELGDARETKMSALRMLLEFGTSVEKNKARQELRAIAFGKAEAAEESEEVEVISTEADDADSLLD